MLTGVFCCAKSETQHASATGEFSRGRSAEENSDWLRTYLALQLFRENRAFFARSDQEVP